MTETRGRWRGPAPYLLTGSAALLGLWAAGGLSVGLLDLARSPEAGPGAAIGVGLGTSALVFLAAPVAGLGRRPSLYGAVAVLAGTQVAARFLEGTSALACNAAGTLAFLVLLALLYTRPIADDASRPSVLAAGWAGAWTILVALGPVGAGPTGDRVLVVAVAGVLLAVTWTVVRGERTRSLPSYTSPIGLYGLGAWMSLALPSVLGLATVSTSSAGTDPAGPVAIAVGAQGGAGALLTAGTLAAQVVGTWIGCAQAAARRPRLGASRSASRSPSVSRASASSWWAPALTLLCAALVAACGAAVAVGLAPPAPTAVVLALCGSILAVGAVQGAPARHGGIRRVCTAVAVCAAVWTGASLSWVSGQGRAALAVGCCLLAVFSVWIERRRTQALEVTGPAEVSTEFGPSEPSGPASRVVLVALALLAVAALGALALELAGSAPGLAAG